MDETNNNKFQGEKTAIALSSEKAASNCVSDPPDEEYSSRKKVGIALIFNHELINGEEPRKGTNVNRDYIKAALESFGFDARVHNDLKLKDLKAELRKVAGEDHSENDCLVIVVMSHGSMGEVCAKDATYPVDSLWKPFLGNNCKTLINKPKIIVIEACRGNEPDLPVLVPMSAGKQKPVNRCIPTSADLLVFYSTFEGHPSFQSNLTGSWFIQSLCKCLEEAAANSPEGTELLRLLNRVSRKVAYEYQSRCDEEKFNNTKEMPTIVSTLTKIFYLKVKKGTNEIREK